MRIYNNHHRIFQINIPATLSMMFFIGLVSLGTLSCSDYRQNQVKAEQPFPLSELKQLKIVHGSNNDFANKTLVINFWATWCTPCRKEMPELQKLSNTLDHNRFAVIGVSVDEDVNLVKEFLLQYKIQFTHFQDDNFRIANQLLDIKAFPETFIVSPSGEILKRITGEQQWDENSFKNVIANHYRIKEVTHQRNEMRVI